MRRTLECLCINMTGSHPWNLAYRLSLCVVLSTTLISPSVSIVCGVTATSGFVYVRHSSGYLKNGVPLLWLLLHRCIAQIITVWTGMVVGVRVISYHLHSNAFALCVLFRVLSKSFYSSRSELIHCRLWRSIRSRSSCVWRWVALLLLCPFQAIVGRWPVRKEYICRFLLLFTSYWVV